MAWLAHDTPRVDELSDELVIPMTSLSGQARLTGQKIAPAGDPPAIVGRARRRAGCSRARVTKRDHRHAWAGPPCRRRPAASKR
jgi:hypothetical protein